MASNTPALDQEGPWTKENNKAMAMKLSEKLAIIMLKKHRKFCRRGLTQLDATPAFEKLFRYLGSIHI